jgi:hypothetical protein
MSVKHDDLDYRDLTGLYCQARDRPVGSDIPARPLPGEDLGFGESLCVGAPVVKLVMTMLCMWGRGRPCGLVWCSKEATIHC